MQFSIITPTLNGLQYLRDCVQSVLEQNYNSVEHLIIDGGSTDGTIEFLRSLKAQHGERIRWISKPDDGIAQAVNRGLALASGGVIGWIGADDKLAPKALAVVARYFEEYPSVLWLYGSYAVIDAEGRFLRLRPAQPFHHRRFVRRGYICGPSIFMRSELIRRVGPLREDLVYAMDFEWWLRMAAVCEPHRLEVVLAYFRWRPDSISVGQRPAQLDEGLKISLLYARNWRERAAIRLFYKAAKPWAWRRRIGRRIESVETPMP